HDWLQALAAAHHHREGALMEQGCIFCQIIAGEALADKVYETDDVLAFRDINPQAPVHILLVPKKHIARLADAAPDDQDVMGALMLAAKAVAEQEGVADGFRLVTNNGRQAGLSVFHLHFHLMGGRRFTWPPG